MKKVAAGRPDQMQIEIKLALDMVVGGAWKTGRHPGAVKRQGEFGGLIGETMQGDDLLYQQEHNMNFVDNCQDAWRVQGTGDPNTLAHRPFAIP